jgi:hypothetical protein
MISGLFECPLIQLQGLWQYLHIHWSWRRVESIENVVWIMDWDKHRNLGRLCDDARCRIDFSCSSLVPRSNAVCQHRKRISYLVFQNASGLDMCEVGTRPPLKILLYNRFETSAVTNRITFLLDDQNQVSTTSRTSLCHRVKVSFHIKAGLTRSFLSWVRRSELEITFLNPIPRLRLLRSLLLFEFCLLGYNAV